MSNLIIIPGQKRDYKKDCADWVPLNDGTLTGDTVYCDRSTVCKQLGMKTDYCFIKDLDGSIICDYFCTGFYADKEIIDNRVDEEAH